MRTPSFGMRVRHRRSQRQYMVLGRQKLQISPDTLARAIAASGKNSGQPLTSTMICEALEKMTFISYHAILDGSKWARPETEFGDSRFEEVEVDPTTVKMASTGSGCQMCGGPIGDNVTICPRCDMETS